MSPWTFSADRLRVCHGTATPPCPSLGSAFPDEGSALEGRIRSVDNDYDPRGAEVSLAHTVRAI